MAQASSASTTCCLATGVIWTCSAAMRAMVTIRFGFKLRTVCHCSSSSCPHSAPRSWSSICSLPSWQRLLLSTTATLFKMAKGRNWCCSRSLSSLWVSINDSCVAAVRSATNSRRSRQPATCLWWLQTAKMTMKMIQPMKSRKGPRDLYRRRLIRSSKC